MDALLTRLGVQAMNMAIRSGIALTSTYAVRQCSRLLQTVDDKSIRAELKSLQKELDEKIKIISPAIDLIEFKSGRGNVFLETAAPLAKSLRQSIVALGKQLEDVAGSEEAAQRAATTTRPRSPESQSAQLRPIIDDMRRLLARIERDAHMLQFAINASGENLSTSLPPGVSPSRLMQASTFLTIGDTQFASDPARPVQIGPSFTLSLYMLFLGHSSDPTHPPGGETSILSPSRPQPTGGKAPEQGPYGFGEGERKPLWQEVMHKARARLCRVPAGWEFDRERGYLPAAQSNSLSSRGGLSGGSTAPVPTSEYIYHLEIIEDLDDGRVHDFEGISCRPFDDLPKAGMRESVPVHQISKIFYTNTGRILNIGGSSGSDNNPVLLLKRDLSAPTPTQVVEEIMQIPHEDDTVSHNSDDSQSVASNTQHECDSQLRLESEDPEARNTAARDARAVTEWSFPRHLDTEWMALEVFMEDDEDDDSTSGSGDELSDSDGDNRATAITVTKRPTPKANRSSLDSKLMAQIRNISLRPPSTPTKATAAGSSSPSPSPRDLEKAAANTEMSPESFVSRSPFRAVTTSLSLMEVLIRLASLQEFQQLSHLSIPDHILTFFLEETATTGLTGEDRWKARSEAKRKVGFDPYLDTPHK